LCQLVLPLKKRRMQSTVGRSGGDMLCGLRIVRTVSSDHQHDVIYRNGSKRLPLQQFIKNMFWFTLGNSNPISQSFEHALRPGVMGLVITGKIVRPQSFNPGYADWFSLAIRILRTMVGMQTMRFGDRKSAVGIMLLAIAR